ncbi:MAG: NAD(P)/FAD-dependent oxidoreductase [Solirubrobacteraceae bacterium]|nr:NAD(P)/FAD-dependent oxidoreductase [Solirubrobacteraceae bacterium]
MPVRATKRGDARTPLSGDYDVLICGASFAGLTVARELAGSGANVLVIDRYEIGERQTSACAAPTEWLEKLGLGPSIRQTFHDLLIHRPRREFGSEPKDHRWTLPWSFSTFDYRQLCELLAEQGEAEFETAKVEELVPAQDGDGQLLTVRTDRGDLRAPIVIDALGWRRVLSTGTAIQPPNATLSRGLEVHPPISEHAPDLELWLDPKYIGPGYSWAFPAKDEVRIGVGSFDPALDVKQPTLELTADEGVPAKGWQGNYIPHKLRNATEGSVFFVGDSAGHCLPTTAEGIRPALYFGLALGRELRAVVEGRQTREQALERYAAFHDEHRFAYDWLLRVQKIVGVANPRPLMDSALQLFRSQRFVSWSFNHYLDICPPAFIDVPEPAAAEPAVAPVAPVPA